MKNNSKFLAVLALSLVFSSMALADPVVDQAEAYNAVFGSSLTSKAATQIPGVINLKTVLPGFVYRAGSTSHGQLPLTDSALENLCEQGFSAAIYTYPTKGGFQEHSVKCSKGTIDYYGYSGENSKGRGKAMAVIAQAIESVRGPVLVHCWNGLHSSGNMAGAALETFCGYSSSEAKSYWKSNAGSAAAQAGSQYEGEVHPYALNLSSQARQALCGN